MEKPLNNTEFLLTQIFTELRTSNKKKKKELKQQLFFIELIEEALPIDDGKKRVIHEKTIRRSYLND